MSERCPTCGSDKIEGPLGCPSCDPDWKARAEAAEAELERVRGENEAMRETTYCVYCGERFPLDGSQESAVGEHVLTCPEHPMRAAERERDEARAEAKQMEAERNEYYEDWEMAAAELDRCAELAGEALGTDPELRTAAPCVEVLANHAEFLRDEADRLRATVARVVNMANGLCTCNEEALAIQSILDTPVSPVRVTVADVHVDYNGDFIGVETDRPTEGIGPGDTLLLVPVKGEAG